MLLTQSTTPIIGWIATLLGYIVEFIYNAFSSIGIQNVGLSILIFTIIVRIILLPLMIKQQKASKINAIMQPEIKKIQKKYRNKKDANSIQRQNEEIKAVYEKYGSSPSSGCLQTAIQLPIIWALFYVIRKIPAYIGSIKAVYTPIVDAIMSQKQHVDIINYVAKGVKSSYITTLAKGATSNEIIDVLTFFNKSAWRQLAAAFPNCSTVIAQGSAKIVEMNNFVLGLNISQIPGWKPSIYWIIPILAGVLQFIVTKTMPIPAGDDSTANMTKSMTWMMPLMSVYFCMIMPTGLGIYWAVSSLLQLIQQICLNKYFEKKDLDEILEKNRAKAAKKKEKGKKSIMEKLQDKSTNAQAEQEKQQARRANSISSIANMNLKKAGNTAKAEKTFIAEEYAQLGNLSKNAHLVEKYDFDHVNKGGNK